MGEDEEAKVAEEGDEAAEAKVKPRRRRKRRKKSKFRCCRSGRLPSVDIAGWSAAIFG